MTSLRVVLWAAVVVAAVAASAHSPDSGVADGELDPRLDALPPELADLRVQLHDRLAPQLMLENRGERTLEVLDDRGVAFLRIGPRGVQGNLAAPAWYRGLTPETAVVPTQLATLLREGKPVPDRWVWVSDEPSWGWFDARLEAGTAAKPDRHAADAPPRWAVPVRLGETTSALRGGFVPQQRPTGELRARLSSDPQIAPGVRIVVLPGQPGSFFLKSESELTVTVLGRGGEPLLRLGRTGVEANLRSATFAEVAQLRRMSGLALEPGAEGEPRWQRLSSGSSFGWIDPRTLYGDGPAPESVTSHGDRVDPLKWRLPIRIGAEESAELIHVEGVTQWEPFRSERSEGNPERADGAS